MMLAKCQADVMQELTLTNIGIPTRHGHLIRHIGQCRDAICVLDGCGQRQHAAEQRRVGGHAPLRHVY